MRLRSSVLDLRSPLEQGGPLAVGRVLLRAVESGAWRVMRKIESSLRSRENENSLFDLVFSPYLVFSLFRSYQTLDPKPQTRSSLVLSLHLMLL